MYQQPHLVPPMKLTVWDELPPTPQAVSSQIFSFITHSKGPASQASGSASLSTRRKPPGRLTISHPQPALTVPEDLLYRRRSFRPLELSIYMPSNRLSELPEFDALSFTDAGEIKFPPRALVRTRSEEVLPISTRREVVAPKPASMYERRVSHMRSRANTASSVVSTSRPRSEHEALRSHPVSWCSLPGLPPHINMVARPENSIDVLTPMQEEFSPPATASLMNDIVMDFPRIETKHEVALESAIDDEEAPAPSPKIPPNALNGTAPRYISTHPNLPATYFHTNYQTQKRISQWLAARSHSASISTVKSTSTAKSSSTTSSFAEHRRKRSQFYQLSANQVPPPQPLRLKQQHHHQRSMTVSSVASTVNTDIFDNDDMESMTTAPTASEIQSRTGTVKSVSAGTGVMRPIVSGIPLLPEEYGEVINEKAMEEVMIAEINGPLRSPGVGMAF